MTSSHVAQCTWQGQDAQHLIVKIQQLQREKVDLENTLEAESECVVRLLEVAFHMAHCDLLR